MMKGTGGMIRRKRWFWGWMAAVFLLGIMALPQTVRADNGRWVETGNRWWYQNEDGTYPAAQWKQVNGVWYYFDSQGWMAADTWIGGYYVDQSGAWVQEKTQKQETAGWIKSGVRWWYRHSDGGYTRSGWEKISGEWYYFDGQGWMVTGWQNVNGTWYYLADSGKMLTGWQRVNGTWYYLESSGRMLTGWQWVGGKCYYLNPSGAMAADTWIDGYYVDQSGAWIQGKTQNQAAAGWIKSGGRWWYRHGDGGYTRSGWEKIGGDWYYFDSQGWMATGWQNVNGTWYYLSDSGRMLTGWQWIGGKCYYLAASGAMAANTWVDGYYVDQSGAWVPGSSSGSGRKKIAIDAGHQRKGNSQKEPVGPGSSVMKAKVAAGTSGKWSGLNEYELTLQVSLKLRDELKNRGYEVYMIRESHDVDISNAQRAKNAADAGADILVRIHANGDNNSSVYGALTMAPSGGNPYLSQGLITASQKLSQRVVDGLCKSTGAKNRGVMNTDDMSGINWSTIPVTIVEMGFMTNRTEDLNMAGSSYQNKMVMGIANGIDQYYS